MAVFRVERTRDYTVMCNHHLKDSNLSLKAKGLLSMMLSLPDEWNYTTRGLAAICKEGVDAIGKTLKELELAGYIIRRQLRGKDGRISDTEYTIFEKPRKPSPPDTTLPDTENPYLDNPDTEAPDTDNPAQLNTKKSNTQKSNTDLSSTHSFFLPAADGMTDGFEKKAEIREQIEYDILCQQYDRIHNLKQAAKTLSVYQQYGFTSPEQLEAAVDTAYQKMRQTSGELKALETKLQGKKKLQRQVLAYAQTKAARDGLRAQKSEKARAAYRQAHESDFIIADAAARYFKAHGITKLPARKALQAEIEQLISEKDGLYNTYHEQKQRFKELQTVKRNIDQILRRDEPHRRKEQSHER